MAKKKPQPETLTVAPAGNVSTLPGPETGRKGRRGKKCHVCGGDVASFTAEDLCWVCRRLKISAWRESDNQAAMQE